MISVKNRAATMAETKYPSRRAFILLRRAEIHLRARRYEDARADASRALTLNLEATGPGAPSSLSGRAHLTIARAWQAEGKLVEARAAYASALEHLRAALGEDHPETREAAAQTPLD